ncbi:MAG: DUF413 domain-containing protein [Burkholderiales bacterium]
MNKSLLDHWTYLSRADYSIPGEVDQTEFTPAELRLIRKYGAWMQALERGSLMPLTRAQQQFLQVCRGKAEPTCQFAAAWKKLKKAARSRESDDTSAKAWAPCPVCGGTGGANGSCLRCKGTGWFDDLRARTGQSRDRIRLVVG